MTFIAALICIIMAFITALVGEKDIIFNSLGWTVMSLAFSMLPGFAFGNITFVKKSDA